jgi:hypothetical protein
MIFLWYKDYEYVRLERSTKKMGKHRFMTVHHRKPSSIGGSDHPRNLSRLLLKFHRAWHILFKNFRPEEIARLINLYYLDPDYEFVVRRKH